MDLKTQIYARFLHFLRDRFDLMSDKADELETIEYLKKGVEFRGTNLWVLIFAIFIASIGLNVNSTAVVIGAMLISPLMGPIMGLGLSVGINDLDLLKRSFKNLGIAVSISVLTSGIYFFVSPLSDAQSELLARTTPTIYDVLIALFGGLAGIVASTRKEKSNVIPGVAIATALMPPLCTAGYGLATGNMVYFFGAFYLFFINSVFISLSAYLLVRFMKYPQVSYVDEAGEVKVTRIITVFVLLTILPSVYLGYNLISRSFFERNANKFIAIELDFDKARIISKNLTFVNSDSSRIEITLFGEEISADMIEQAEKKLPLYDLGKTKLVVFQGYSKDQIQRDEFEKMNLSLRSGIIEDLYKKNEEVLKDKDKKIDLLQNELLRYKRAEKENALPVHDLSREIKINHESLLEFTINKSVLSKPTDNTQDTLYLAYANFQKKLDTKELERLENWLRVRLNSDKVRLIIE